MKIDTESESPIARGIQAVGVGKKGSRELDAGLVAEIIASLLAGSVSDLERGAFYGALVMKGIASVEKPLAELPGPGAWDRKDELALFLAPDAPVAMQNILARLLDREFLTEEEAFRCGTFLMSSEPGEGARGAIASILRVRYESEAEYLGLARSLRKTMVSDFSPPLEPGPPVIQIAEPFDGVNRSYLLSPIIAHFFTEAQFRTVCLTGRSGGPKYQLNLQDLGLALGGRFLKKSQEFPVRPDSGIYISQEQLSPALDAWVERRRTLLKRPFFATLEKYLDPCGASILLVSAFHSNYGEKMRQIAQGLGFPGVVVVQRGQEGSLAFSMKRPMLLYCAAQTGEGSYVQKDFTLSVDEVCGFDMEGDPRVREPDVAENARLVQNYIRSGTTGDEALDRRVMFTLRGLSIGVDWVSRSLGLQGIGHETG